jgi:hypothetical protein
MAGTINPAAKTQDRQFRLTVRIVMGVEQLFHKTNITDQWWFRKGAKTSLPHSFAFVQKVSQWTWFRSVLQFNHRRPHQEEKILL